MYPIRLPKLRAAVLGLAFLISVLPAAWAAEWHVDAKATGSGDGSSWSNAWRSLAAISWNSIGPGDTIWVRGGPYDERLVVGKGGGSVATRIKLVGVDRPVLRGIDGGSHDYVAVIGFEIAQVSTATKYDGISLNGVTGWLIQDNYIHDTYAGGINGRYNSVNSNNVVRANVFDHITGNGGGASGAPVINLFGDRNLVEYNRITRSLDRVRAFGTANVVRNNYFGATDSRLYPSSSPYPHHVDSFQSYNSTRALSQLLYERNWDQDNCDSVGGTNAHGMLIQDQADQGYNWAISRFNVLIRVGGVAYQFQNFDRFYGYNLTSIAVQNGAPRIWRTAVSEDSPSTSNLHDWRNNTWSYSPNTASGIFPADRLPANFSQARQHSFDAGALPASSANLGSVDPRFTNRGGDDYTLQTSSPLRNVGAPITTASGNGSNSKQLKVADSRRLFDGWGIADGDIIKVGTTGSYVRVSSINYSTNVVTLGGNRSWRSGDPVFVKGSEDVGALPFAFARSFEVTNTTPSSLPAGPVTLSASVSAPDAVRKVEFLVDGIPVGEKLSAPYQITWASDGKPHTVEARAYNAWAGAILHRSKTISVSGTSNSAPTISSIPDRSLNTGGSTGALSFTVGDAETSADRLTLTGKSSNLALVPSANVTFGGSGSTRTVTVTPASGQTGSATITATVSDGALSTSTSFVVTVTAPTVAPTINSQPSDRTVTAGDATTFTVGANGSPSPTYRWQLSTGSTASWSNLSDSATYTGTTAPTLKITAVTTAMNNYRYRSVITNSAGTVTSAAATLTLAQTNLPRITAQPQSVTVPLGGSTRFAVTAEGDNLAYQWKKDGTDLVGRVYSSFSLSNVQSSNAGTYTVVVTGSGGSVTSAAATLTISSSSTSSPPAPEPAAEESAPPISPLDGLASMSTQALVEEGELAMTAEIVVGAESAKTVLIRALGPALAESGVGGVLQDPVLEVFLNDQPIASNDNWGTAANASEIASATQAVGASALTQGSRDAALLFTLSPGRYRVRVTGAGGGDAAAGVALLEVHELP